MNYLRDATNGKEFGWLCRTHLSYYVQLTYILYQRISDINIFHSLFPLSVYTFLYVLAYLCNGSYEEDKRSYSKQAYEPRLAQPMMTNPRLMIGSQFSLRPDLIAPMCN